jgi:aspartyl protease family protein
MRSVIVFAAFALVAAATIPRYAAPMKGDKRAPLMIAVRPEAPASSAASDSRVVVPPDARGHFLVDGRIDGQPLDFMIDTGASVIALTADGAATAGIYPAAREFTALIGTANGKVYGAPVQLDRVEIGDLMLHDVDAVVLPKAALSENLLGLSFLSRLRHFEYTDGKLVLEQ